MCQLLKEDELRDVVTLSRWRSVGIGSVSPVDKS